MAQHMICFMLRNPGKYSAVIVIAFYSRKDQISFARFVSCCLVMPPIFTTNVRATITSIWTWIDLFWNILVKVKRNAQPSIAKCLCAWVTPVCSIVLHWHSLAECSPSLLDAFVWIVSCDKWCTITLLFDDSMWFTHRSSSSTDALKFDRSISTLMPVFVDPEDNSLERKLVALPWLLNIGSLLDLLVSRGPHIYSGEFLSTFYETLNFFLWQCEFYLLVEGQIALCLLQILDLATEKLMYLGPSRFWLLSDSSETCCPNKL